MMVAEDTLMELMVEVANRGGLFMLEFAAGAVELHGGDQGGESGSDLHLKKGGLRAARIVEEADSTPYLGFWSDCDMAGNAIMRVNFPSFFDWARDKAPIAANRTWYSARVRTHGREFRIRP